MTPSTRLSHSPYSTFSAILAGLGIVSRAKISIMDRAGMVPYGDMKMKKLIVAVAVALIAVFGFQAWNTTRASTTTQEKTVEVPKAIVEAQDVLKEAIVAARAQLLQDMSAAETAFHKATYAAQELEFNTVVAARETCEASVQSYFASQE